MLSDTYLKLIEKVGGKINAYRISSNKDTATIWSTQDIIDDLFAETEIIKDNYEVWCKKNDYCSEYISIALNYVSLHSEYRVSSLVVTEKDELGKDGDTYINIITLHKNYTVSMDENNM